MSSLYMKNYTSLTAEEKLSLAASPLGQMAAFSAYIPLNYLGVVSMASREELETLNRLLKRVCTPDTKVFSVWVPFWEDEPCTEECIKEKWSKACQQFRAQLETVPALPTADLERLTLYVPGDGVLDFVEASPAQKKQLEAQSGRQISSLVEVFSRFDVRDSEGNSVLKTKSLAA
jgi:hypothetical protein